MSPLPHVLLLRAVNVGGHQKLPMASLVALVEALGATEVRTYIQSGNALARLAPEEVPALTRALRASLQAAHGFDTPVIARSLPELEALVAGLPFPGEEDRVYVAFLEDVPDPARVAALDPGARSPSDRLVLRGRDAYLHLPQGVAGTRLDNAWLERQLGTASTLRNWRTVTTLARLLGDAPAAGAALPPRVAPAIVPPTRRSP